MAQKLKSGKTAERQVRISDALHKRLAVFAAQQSASKSALAQAAIDEWLKRRSA